MIPLLKDFKHYFQESLLGFLWRQWSALGVPGHAVGDDPWIIDPEALLLFSLALCRHEPRLFDEIMNWLDTHGHMIHIQRLRRILKHESFSSPNLLASVAAVMANRGTLSKWNRLASISNGVENPEILFYGKNDTHLSHFGATDPEFEKYGYLRGPLQFRKHTQSIQIMKHTGLLFRLRSLFGVNARADIFLYLLTHETGHPRKIARECYYYQKTIQDALVEIASTGIVRIQQRGKEKHYQIHQEDWYSLLKITDSRPVWITWPLVFSALEQVWLKFRDPDFLNLENLLQSSELRQLMKTLESKIEMAGFGLVLTDHSQYLGETYTPVFVQDIYRLLEKLHIKK